MFLARCCHADVKHCVPVETRFWVKHKNKRTCLNLQLRTGCEARVNQYQPETFDSPCFCLSRPAPPSSVTSTDPPRLWEDTSLQQTYRLSGKVHIAPAVSALHVYFFLHLCFFITTVLTGRNVLTPKFCFTFPPRQKRLRRRRLLAKVRHAWRGAGAAQKFYPEQEDGVQRLQAVPVRPRAGWVAGHVYRSAVLKSVFKSLVAQTRLRKSEDLFFFFEASCCKRTEEKQTHRLHGVCSTR